MKFSRLDSNGDWTFGRGLANYAVTKEALALNVKTRLKSFANDWFLDTDANIDWLTILSTKNNEILIVNEVNRVLSETDGVVKVNSIEPVVNRETRYALINCNITTVYDRNLFLSVDI